MCITKHALLIILSGVSHARAAGALAYTPARTPGTGSLCNYLEDVNTLMVTRGRKNSVEIAIMRLRRAAKEGGMVRSHTDRAVYSGPSRTSPTEHQLCKRMYPAVHRVD